MAKIKSTLDIVMERTRNLTITQEEKDALRRKELLDRVRGWVQALVDGKSSVSDLRSAYAEEAAQDPEARDILRGELLGHIDPDTDIDRVLDAYTDILGLDGGHIVEAVASYRSCVDTCRGEQRERLRGVLAASGVAGSAVLPNVQADPEWEALSIRLKERFSKSLR